MTSAQSQKIIKERCTLSLTHKIINVILEKYTNNDAMVNKKQIDQQIQIIGNRPDMEIKIKIHWLKSHHESTYKNDVDGYAKVAALIVQYLFNYNTTCDCNGKPSLNNLIASRINNKIPNCTCIWKPNQYISYNTIKNEIKTKTFQHEKLMWNKYKLDRATK